ncbi:ABC transporter substrate-binding protein [Desertibacillus haloalkaliphilus]|uniref:ABC transporter substrate-binding protein n=1 Tax=Desertibacillus haloalkaliphilus TaxID=1328930 RepID=UPI001C26626B|nr:glycine betaine ABC transporter substrate-binding protein [Desertibacillus haloalkaliphilus]MBU8908369.1 glycine betaine ABC transporter substrate-binding protein [Desertibacillus haloalkaliphilus]
MKTKTYLAIALTLLLLLLAACGNDSTSSDNLDSKGTLVVGGKNFTEQFILAKITSIYLKENGYEIEEKTNMGSEVLRQALSNEQVDLYWEYTGTGLINYLDQEPASSAEEAYQTVKAIDKEENQIEWLDMSNVNNTYTLMIREDHAEQLGIQSISDLANYVNENPGTLTFASNAEFATRSDGLSGVEDVYDFQFGSSNVIRMDSGLTYQALDEGQVDIAMGFSTDSRIKGFDLLALEDDKEFFPAYNAAVTVREAIVDEHPELVELLAPLAESLDTETMTTLNYTVDIEQMNESEVAREWLLEQGLIEE